MAAISNSARSKISNRGCALVAGRALLAGAIFFLGAVLWGEVRLALFGAKADGLVTKVEERSTSSHKSRREGESRESYQKRSSSSVSYMLTVRFTHPGGEDAEFKTTSTFGHELKAGDAVKVIYLPNRPAKAEIYSAKQLWLPMAVGLTVSTVSFALGAFLLRLANHLRRPPPPPSIEPRVEIR